MASVIGRLEDFPVGAIAAIQVDGKSIAVANLDGTLFAIDDLCNHRGCSLTDGFLASNYIVCSCHRSVFQLTDGSVVGGPATKAQTVYAIEVADGNVTVSLPATGSKNEGGASIGTEPAALPPSQGLVDMSPVGRTSPGRPDHERVHSALISVPLFADLDRESIERLEAFTFRKTFSPGEVIVEEGHTGNGLYVVLSGTVEVIKERQGQHPQKVAALGAGEPFGEMALLGDWKRSASVLAMDEVECLGMDRWAFLAHLKSEPNLAIRMLQMLANRLEETNKRLVE